MPLHNNILITEINGKSIYNWQPDLGYFELTEDDSIFHNRGNDYEAAYKIDYLDKNRFIRRSWRYMQKSGGSGANKWEKGDRVEFIESFVPDY